MPGAREAPEGGGEIVPGAREAPGTVAPAEVGATKKTPSPSLPRFAGEGAPARLGGPASDSGHYQAYFPLGRG